MGVGQEGASWRSGGVWVVLNGARSAAGRGGCRAGAMGWQGGVGKGGGHLAIGVSEVVIDPTLTKYVIRAIFGVARDRGVALGSGRGYNGGVSVGRKKREGHVRWVGKWPLRCIERVGVRSVRGVAGRL